MGMSDGNKSVIVEYVKSMQEAEGLWSMARISGDYVLAERRRADVDTYARMINTLLQVIAQSK